MELLSDSINVDVILECDVEKLVSDIEESVDKFQKDLFSQNLFEVDYEGIVKILILIRNVLDNVFNKNVVQEYSGEVVKKNFFEVIFKEFGGKDKSEI